ncbi:MAG: sulfite exporter TauE/SafE family protein [Tissierellia bacterium]|nr:sulfite exporter TauE/SafE family protein [Tissierellia bacterium]
MVTILFSVLGIICIFYLIYFIRDFIEHRDNLEDNSWWKLSTIGFVTNFFDVLGIGSFATGASLLRIFKQSNDRVIPGTLNVGYTIPVMLEALIFIKVIKVEPLTLIGMIISALIGSWLGAGIVSKFSEERVQKVMGGALIATGVLMTLSQIGLIPSGGNAIGLGGGKLVFALVVNLILGALMTAGIGLYAPCMVLVYFLGMSPKIAFPIMFGSCAFLMPIASIKFIKEGAYNRKASMAFSTVGVLGVLIAAYFVKSLPINILTWIVIVVVFYTAISMLKAALKPESEEVEEVLDY